MAHARGVSKELSAFADQFILSGFTENVKNFLVKRLVFSGILQGCPWEKAKLPKSKKKLEKFSRACIMDMIGIL